jgi:hypothetical protein
VWLGHSCPTPFESNKQSTWGLSQLKRFALLRPPWVNSRCRDSRPRLSNAEPHTIGEGRNRSQEGRLHPHRKARLHPHRKARLHPHGKATTSVVLANLPLGGAALERCDHDPAACSVETEMNFPLGAASCFNTAMSRTREGHDFQALGKGTTLVVPSPRRKNAGFSP